MKIDARKPEGNAYHIMAVVRQILIQSGRGNKWPETERRMKAGNYDNLCKIAEEATFGCVKVVNRVNEPEEDKR